MSTIIKQHFLRIGVILSAALVIGGCTEYERQKQLTRVARDWSQVITASQVIPVYPLTEDLRPGDIMLVDKPVEEQRNTFQQKGFLPLDRHLVRLFPDRLEENISEENPYDVFYDIIGSHAGNKLKLPPLIQMTEDTNDIRECWAKLPSAGFPTYDFTVKTGTNLSLAIPVEGVPVALGYMNATKASGNVTLSDAHTYGLDIVKMEKIVRVWGNENRGLLCNYPPHKGWVYPRLRWPTGENWWPIYFPKKYTFLRVVSRVYAISGISVTLNNNDEKAGSVAVGQQVNNIYQTDPNRQDPNRKAFVIEENLDQALNLNKYVSDSGKVIGGKLQFVSATTRNITFNKTFDEPLIIGYVGFDMPILDGGRLGSPVSTLDQLTSTSISLPGSTQIAFENIYGYEALKATYDALEENDKRRLGLDKLADDILPSSYPFNIYISDPNECCVVDQNKKYKMGIRVKRDFKYAVTYIEDVKETIFLLIRCGKDPDTLKKAMEEYEKVCNKIRHAPAYVEAIDYVFFGY